MVTGAAKFSCRSEPFKAVHKPCMKKIFEQQTRNPKSKKQLVAVQNKNKPRQTRSKTVYLTP